MTVHCINDHEHRPWCALGKQNEWRLLTDCSHAVRDKGRNTQETNYGSFSLFMSRMLCLCLDSEHTPLTS